MRFSSEEFMTLATFVMCNDQPENTDCINVEILHSILNQIAYTDMDFNNWVQAYHQIDMCKGR